LGDSEPSPSRRTPEQLATELHALLRKAAIAPPYVLVAHAEGAFTIRRFASLYPDEVAGLVLIDPSHEALGARLQALDAASWKDFVDQKKTFYAMLEGTLQAENEAFFQIMREQAVPGIGPLPDVPLAVLTAMRPVEEPRWVGETPEGLQAKFDLHKVWIDQAAHGTHHVAKTSGSYIHSERPALVDKAIREVLEAVRNE
jgi:pimeloyl-ACP methyl ester carboxylesterase